MPRSRFQKLPAADRDQLLDIALARFAAEGLERASLNEILTEAGLSKGSYYYYFEDKEDLFATVLEREVDKLFAAVPMPTFERISAKQFWPLVEGHIARWREHFLDSRPLLAIARHVDAAMRAKPRFRQLTELGRTMWRPMFVAGRCLGCFCTDLSLDSLLELVEAADAAVDRMMYWSNPKPITRKSFSAHVDLAFDTFRRLLVPHD